MNIENFLAKSNGTTLVEHTKAVVNYAAILCSMVYRGDNADEMKTDCMTAAVLHDIGKLTKEFQKKLSENGDVEAELHNIVSWAFAECNGFKDEVSATVLYHHVPTIITESKISAMACDRYGELPSEIQDRMKEFYTLMQTYYNVLPSLGERYGLKEYTEIPLFNIASRTDMARKELFMRSILLKADRDVSSERFDNARIASNDVEYIGYIIQKDSSIDLNTYNIDKAISEKYDMKRLKVQMSIVDDSIATIEKGEKNTVQINASAGFGKTLVGLLSIFHRKKKTIWCVPTREIAISTYESICRELNKIDSTISVALFYGNEIQEKYGSNSNSVDSYSIIVSVIDSMLSRMTNNNMGHLLYALLTRDVIFDEYHNVVTDNALFAAASLLWESRIMDTNAYSMFLSATPLNLRYAGLANMDSVIEINPPKYRGDIKIDFHYAEIFDMKTDMPEIKSNSFVIANTVSQAQDIYCYLKEDKKKTNVFLYHAQYEEQDMIEKRDILFKNFGKNTLESDMIVVCTGIIGTGLDVSAKNIYDFTLTPADTLQRVCGRASRFGEYDTISYYLCDVAKTEPTMGRGTMTFVDRVFDNSLRNTFISLMKQYDNTVFTKDELYERVNNFLNDKKVRFYGFYKEKLSNSRENLRKIGLKKSSSKKDKGAIKYTSKKTSFRGNGTEIFIAAKKESDEGYAIFTYDSERVRRIEKDPDSIDFRKYRWNYYCNKFSDKERKSCKYKFGMKNANTCNFDTCVSMAYCSESPLPVMNLKYSHEYGVEKI